MQSYKGDGDVVKMVGLSDGDRKNPNGHEWVLRSDADNLIDGFHEFLNTLYESGIDRQEHEAQLKDLLGFNT